MLKRQLTYLGLIMVTAALLVGCVVAAEGPSTESTDTSACSSTTQRHVAGWNRAADGLMDSYTDESMSNENFLLAADLMEAKLDLVLAEMYDLLGGCGELLPLEDVINLYEDEL